MPKNFYFILFSTLAFGFCAGFYVYLMTRTPDDVVPTNILPVQTFEIVANQYGGCERLGCSTYRIEDNGSYTFIKYQMGEDEERFSDVITATQLSNLTELLADTDYIQSMEDAFTGACPTTFDGIAYRYDIQYKGQSYSFDSCSQNLEGKAVFSELKDYFDIFRLIHASI